MNFEILNGNELIVQGGLEAGFSLYTGYPGSPLADYFNILHHKKNYLKEIGVRVAIANSEANAAAMASGAKQAGKDVMVAMKSMGLHVAADALSVGNFANPGQIEYDPRFKEELSPGVVIVVGDDPWSMSTSTPADSRYLFKHLHIPFLEPSNPTELKEWINHSLYISKKTSVYQGVLLTTLLAEGGGRVETGEPYKFDKELVNLDTSKFDLSSNVMVPPNSRFADIKMIQERFPKVKEVLKSLGLDKNFGNQSSSVGIISSGVIFETLKQYLEESKLFNEINLYKLASSYPLVEDLLLPFLKSLEHLIILEEKRGFLETEIKELIQKHNLTLKIWGKYFNDQEGFPSYAGLDYEIIAAKFEELTKLNVLANTDKKACSIPSSISNLPKRLPTFCPGCPHRETLSLLKDIRSILKKDNIDLVTHGDVGCYSLSFLPPFKEMHNLSAMGQGGALGAGLDIFSKNPSVVLMGDSTFFHSGLTDVSNSLQLDHDITYILLDNDNTAMTGHQMTPASGVSVEGNSRPRQDMLKLVKSLGVDQAIKINPSDRYFYKNLLLDYIKKSGVKVIVSDKECSLTFQARQRKKERSLLKESNKIQEKSFYQINLDACEDCRECVESTGCPGLTKTFDAYGSKVQIDPQICVNDSYCTKIKACPSFELVKVKNYRPLASDLNSLNLDALKNIPEPVIKKSYDDIAAGDDLRIVVTGVGGSGITTISKVLSHAARKMGGRDDVDFKFVDQKGLAQRNGNVTAHLSFFARGKSSGAQTSLNTADLLISTDLLDGASHLSFLKTNGDLVIDSSLQYPLNSLLDRELDENHFKPDELLTKLKEDTKQNAHIHDFKKFSNTILGKPVYATLMTLGNSFQQGLLPFSYNDLILAIESSVRSDEVEKNKVAFEIGRLLALGKENEIQNINLKTVSLSSDSKAKTKTELLSESLMESFLPWKANKHFKDIFLRNLNKLNEYFPDLSSDYLAKYLHDILVYDRGRNLESFMREAGMIKTLYTSIKHQEIALRTLAKCYFIKDEVFVSHLMISGLRNYEDEKRFGLLGSSTSKTFINRPSFIFLGQKIEFDISPRVWMLKVMRQLRILRTLMPLWHGKDKLIAKKIREKLISEIPKSLDTKNHSEIYQMLMKLDNVKGYREVKYKNAKLYGVLS